MYCTWALHSHAKSAEGQDAELVVGDEPIARPPALKAGFSGYTGRIRTEVLVVDSSTCSPPSPSALTRRTQPRVMISRPSTPRRAALVLRQAQWSVTERRELTLAQVGSAAPPLLDTSLSARRRPRRAPDPARLEHDIAHAPRNSPASPVVSPSSAHLSRPPSPARATHTHRTKIDRRPACGSRPRTRRARLQWGGVSVRSM